MSQERFDSDGVVGDPTELDIAQFFEDLDTPTPGEREVAKQRLQSVFGVGGKPSPRAAPWVKSGDQ